MKYEVTLDESRFIVDITPDGRILLDGEPVEVDFAPMGTPGLYSLLVNNESFEALIEEREDVWHVLFRGKLYEVNVADERTQLLRARAGMEAPESGEIAIKAPMPGLVVAVKVEVGQQVEKGDKIIILESMKMENELKAPRGGRVERINVKERDSVEQNQVLVVIV
jgi:biotin carboxyl carrier protein